MYNSVQQTHFKFEKCLCYKLFIVGPIVCEANIGMTSVW